MEEINQIIRNYNPEKVILFGSKAKGNSEEDSDYDLLIIKDTQTRRLNRREEALKDIYLKVPMDLLILTPNEIEYLKKNKSEFIKEIFDEGVVVYEKK
jgi:predicted nucleotidyltransferase